MSLNPKKVIKLKWIVNQMPWAICIRSAMPRSYCYQHCGPNNHNTKEAIEKQLLNKLPFTVSPMIIWSSNFGVSRNL